MLIVGDPARFANAGVRVVPDRIPDAGPLCAVYARTLLPRVAERLARHDWEMAGLIREVRHVEIGPDELARFDPEAPMLCNVNTPHDYRQACSRMFNR